MPPPDGVPLTAVALLVELGKQAGRHRYRIRELVTAVQSEERTVQRNLEKLHDTGLIRRDVSGPKLEIEVLPPGFALLDELTIDPPPVPDVGSSRVISIRLASGVLWRVDAYAAKLRRDYRLLLFRDDAIQRLLVIGLNEEGAEGVPPKSQEKQGEEP